MPSQCHLNTKIRYIDNMSLETATKSYAIIALKKKQFFT